jgi:uncharacterized membrane protein
LRAKGASLRLWLWMKRRRGVLEDIGESFIEIEDKASGNIFEVMIVSHSLESGLAVPRDWILKGYE